jgi:RNA polymerase sigma factor (sigma-70 family)
MNEREELFQQHLPLADSIAAGYANIPGVQRDDVVSIARQALHRAVEAYDAVLGPLAPFAGRAIRNALNNLYQREMRHQRVMVPEALLASLDSAGDARPLSEQQADTSQNTLMQAGQRETRAILMELMAKLPERTQEILTRLASGQSHAEIGAVFGVSKQAIHKTASAALEFLRAELSASGFDGLDSVGLLKSTTGDAAPAAAG